MQENKQNMDKNISKDEMQNKTPTANEINSPLKQDNEVSQLVQSENTYKVEVVQADPLEETMEQRPLEEIETPGSNEHNKSCEGCNEKDSCPLYNKSIEEKVKEAQAGLDKRKSKKRKVWNIAFLLLNLIVLAVVVITQANTEEGLSLSMLPELIGNNWWCLVLALASFFVYMLFDSSATTSLIKRSTGHYRPFLSYKTVALGHYYDNITPLATGGQPFQIIYMINRGVKPSVATSIPFARTIFSQLAFVITGLCVLIFSKVIAGGLNKPTFYAAVAGLIISATWTLLILFLSVSKIVAPKFVKAILKFLSKIKIIKKPEKTFASVMGFVAEYQKTMRYFMTSIWNMIRVGLETFLMLCMRVCIGFFICASFVGFSIELFGVVFILCTLIDLIMSYIPWPGAAGIAEVSFALLFSYVFVDFAHLPDGGGQALVWAMLLWRFLTFYIFLLQGLLVLLYDFFKGNKKITKTLERLNKIDNEKHLH